MESEWNHPHKPGTGSGSGSQKEFLVGIFITASILLLLISPNYLSAEKIELSADSGVTAQANAIPNHGWAPLTVYFSSFGSLSQDEIVRYEWDLDGNGSIDYDASSQGGYAQYLYYQTRRIRHHPAGHRLQGRLAIRQRERDCPPPRSASVDYWTVFDDSRMRPHRHRPFACRLGSDVGRTGGQDTVQADATIFGEELNDVGFRMRGQFSLRMSGDKKPWKIDTDAYVDGQEFHNLRQLMLLNNIGDPSLLFKKS